MSRPFKNVERNRLFRSVFPLSNIKIMDCDMGILYPVFCRKMVPGDKFQMGNQIVARMQPLIAPLMHEINIFVHYFFVPLRIMWPKPKYDLDPFVPDESSWEEFMTGGVDGLLEPTKPKWVPSSLGQTQVGSLWDLFGFPVNVLPTGAYPDCWPIRAYNMIWNEYYRDQNYMEAVDLDDENVKRRCWEKDYFTTALPWQQRGTAPALPITGFSSAEFLGEIFANTGSTVNTNFSGFAYLSPDKARLINNGSFGAAGASEAYIRDWFNNNRVDLSQASTFDVNDLRLAFQTQRFLEGMARSGARYTEFLGTIYNVNPRDDRLQRPEYVGGSRTPVVISEVLQTSSTDTTSPQGTQAGHGMSVDRQYISSYFAQEFGVMVGIMSIMPRPMYQQGIDREWLGETRYDEFIPEFVSLGEQAVLNAEIYASADEQYNKGVFGFQPRYNELRVSHNQAVGHMRSGVQDSLAFWHLGRYFAQPPALNQEFLECNPRKDFLAVPSKPAFVITFGNKVRAVRPLPAYGTPGLIDHH